MELSYCCFDVKWCNHFGNQFGTLLKSYTYACQNDSHSSPQYLPKKNKSIWPSEDLYMNAQSRCIPRSATLQTQLSSISRWMDEELVLYSHSEVPVSDEEEQTWSMQHRGWVSDSFLWAEEVREDYVLHGSIYVKYKLIISDWKQIVSYLGWNVNGGWKHSLSWFMAVVLWVCTTISTLQIVLSLSLNLQLCKLKQYIVYKWFLDKVDKKK